MINAPSVQLITYHCLMHYQTCSLSYKHVIAGLLPYVRQQRRARAHAAEVLAELKKQKDVPIKPATSSAKPDLAEAEP
jgi:hypothetical protein